MTNGLTLAPCFPPAAGRGARQRRRRGAENGRPALLLCERGEDRNQRSPLPREPNAKISWQFAPAVFFIHSMFKWESHSYVVEGQRASTVKLAHRSVSASFDWRYWKSLDSIIHFPLVVEFKPEDLCRNPSEYLLLHYAHMVWIRLHHSFVYLVMPTEPEYFRPIKGLMCSRVVLWDKKGELKWAVSQSRGQIVSQCLLRHFHVHRHHCYTS